jgi:putative PIN family toxin of toxin-antitoxin system
VRIVIDTNVLVSGLFFGGLPGQILEAWKDENLTLVVSPAILEEYFRVGHVLASKYQGVDLDPLLALIAMHAAIIDAPEISHGICEDPDDDKFMDCAVAGGACVVVSGDKHLRAVSGWQGVDVMTPRAFVERYLVK